MKDSEEKEHRISNLKDMIDNVKNDEDESIDEIEEDSELIEYLNHKDSDNYEELEIDDEFIYRPNDEENYDINLDEDSIDEDFIINTPKTSDDEINDEEAESDEYGEESAISEGFDNLFNAKIGKTPITGVISTILGLAFIVLAALTFASRSDKIVDNVISGENSFIVVIFLALGILLLIYGLFKVLRLRNPLSNISDSINLAEDESPAEEKDDENVIPKSNIPLDKEAYKVGEFKFGDMKDNLTKPVSKPKTMPLEEKKLDDIPPAREKPDDKKGLTAEEIEEIEYEQVKLETETIDDIFAEVEGLDDIPIISVDSKEEKKDE